jgi:hypothetical protein
MRRKKIPEKDSRWSLKALTPAPGYVAAIAVEGHERFEKQSRLRF